MTDVRECPGTKMPLQHACHVHINKWLSLVMDEDSNSACNILPDSRKCFQLITLNGPFPVSGF